MENKTISKNGMKISAISFVIWIIRIAINPISLFEKVLLSRDIISENMLKKVFI